MTIRPLQRSPPERAARQMQPLVERTPAEPQCPLPARAVNPRLPWPLLISQTRQHVHLQPLLLSPRQRRPHRSPHSTASEPTQSERQRPVERPLQQPMPAAADHVARPSRPEPAPPDQQQQSAAPASLLAPPSVPVAPTFEQQPTPEQLQPAPALLRAQPWPEQSAVPRYLQRQAGQRAAAASARSSSRLLRPAGRAIP